MEPNTKADFETALRSVAPSSAREAIERLAILLTETTQGRLSEQELQIAISRDPTLLRLLQSLSGKEVSTHRALVSFGPDDQLGDMSIKDVIGGHQINISLPAAAPSTHTQTRNGLVLAFSVLGVGLLALLGLLLINMIRTGGGVVATVTSQRADTEVAGANSEVSLAASTSTIALTTIIPTIEPMVTVEESTGVGVSETYQVILGANEIIVGDAMEVNGNNNQGRGCIAFLVRGAIEYDMRLRTGGWRKYKPISSQRQVEELFDDAVQRLLKNTPCTSETVLRLRLP